MTVGVANPVSYPALSITTTSLPTERTGRGITAGTVHRSASPYKVWTLIAGALPSGLSLARADGTVSGTPTATGTASFTVQVEDAGHQFATRALSLQVN